MVERSDDELIRKTVSVCGDIPVLKDTWYENPVKDNDVTNVPEQSD